MGGGGDEDHANENKLGLFIQGSQPLSPPGRAGVWEWSERPLVSPGWGLLPTGSWKGGLRSDSFGDRIWLSLVGSKLESGTNVGTLLSWTGFSLSRPMAAG